MNQQHWTITYTKDAVTGSEEMTWPGPPDREHAAQFLRERLFPDGYLIPDTPRSDPEPTVYQMRRHGVEIITIEPAPMPSPDETVNANPGNA